jgi:hypothetical protein
MSASQSRFQTLLDSLSAHQESAFRHPMTYDPRVIQQFIFEMEALKLRADDVIHLAQTLLENPQARRDHLDQALPYLRQTEDILNGLTNLMITLSQLLFGSEETVSPLDSPMIDSWPCPPMNLDIPSNISLIMDGTEPTPSLSSTWLMKKRK